MSHAFQISRLGLIAFALAAGIAAVAAAPAYVDDILFERDTPYVPTPPDVVDRMLDMAAVQKGEYLIDLGSGDGRIAIAAAKRGARAMGVELKPDLVKQANANAAKAGVADLAHFEVRDLFKTEIATADVLTLYLLPLVNLDLRPRILNEMRPGTRVVAHAFHMGDWLPDASDNIRNRVLFYWTVPARVNGRWRVESEDGNFTLDITQKFQKFDASADVERRLIAILIEAHTTTIQDGRIDGANIRFAVDLGEGPRAFHGRVEGDTIRGVTPQGWKATRVK